MARHSAAFSLSLSLIWLFVKIKLHLFTIYI